MLFVSAGGVQFVPDAVGYVRSAGGWMQGSLQVSRVKRLIVALKSSERLCYRQMLKLTRESTATMMLAAKVAWGRKYKAGVNNKDASVMPIAVKMPAASVCAPASKLTT